MVRQTQFLEIVVSKLMDDGRLVLLRTVTSKYLYSYAFNGIRILDHVRIGRQGCNIGMTY